MSFKCAITLVTVSSAARKSSCSPLQILLPVVEVARYGFQTLGKTLSLATNRGL